MRLEPRIYSKNYSWQEFHKNLEQSFPRALRNKKMETRLSSLKEKPRKLLSISFTFNCGQAPSLSFFFSIFNFHNAFSIPCHFNRCNTRPIAGSSSTFFFTFLLFKGFLFIFVCLFAVFCFMSISLDTTGFFINERISAVDLRDVVRESSIKRIVNFRNKRTTR